MAENSDETNIVSVDKNRSESSRWGHYLRLFAVKPVTIFYGMSFVVTNSSDTQLWLDR